jgi:glycosyltransferase involved in cell wall biosynthesis
MRIIQIGPYPIDENKILGGVRTSVYGLSKELIKQHEVFVLDFPNKNIPSDYLETLSNIKVHRIKSVGNSRLFSFLLTYKYVRLISSIKPDICHFHGTSVNVFILWLIVHLKYKSIVTIHGLANVEKRNIWKKEKSFKNYFQYIYQSIVEMLFISVCSKFIVDTPYVKREVENYYKKNRIIKVPECYVIPQGIDHAFFSLECTPHKNQILSVGTLGKRKGRLELIEAFKIVVRVIPDAKLIIMGGKSDLNYFEDIIMLIDQNNLQEHITIVADALNSDIQKNYSLADIFVLHSEEESQGIVFCQAMSAGLAIISTNVGGVPDVIENNINGLLSNFGDINTFADNMIKLLLNPKLKNEMSKQNRITAQKYSWNVIANDVIKLYDLK